MKKLIKKCEKIYYFDAKGHINEKFPKEILGKFFKGYL